MRACEPSERNFEIFAEVEFGGLSLRAAAEKFDLSPTRVTQVVQQVRHWLKQSTPKWAQDDLEALPFVACRIWEERLRFLYAEALDAWRASKTEVWVRREAVNHPEAAIVRTTRSFGQVRYLAQAMRLAEAQLRSALRLAEIQSRRQAPHATEPSAPPEEVCALQSPEAAEQITDAPEEIVATHEAAALSAPQARDVLPLESDAIAFPNPVRSRLERKLARHAKRQAARERKRARQHA